MTPLLDLLATSPGLFIGTTLVLGLLVGSFLNVVIYRVPIILERQWREQCEELAAEDSTLGGTAAAPHGPEPSAGTQTDPTIAGAVSRTDSPFNLIVPRSACP